MWTVTYGRHFVYLKYKEYRYETRWYILAFFVHQWWHARYTMSVYPVKYVRIYKSDDVVKLSTYNISKEGDYERLRKKRSFRTF